MSIKLTDEQQAIIEHQGGHAEVLAVAGSGKTFTMCHRINYLVKHKKVNPKRIRVLMFNCLAKDSVIKNLEELGFDEDSVPYVAAFHGF